MSFHKSYRIKAGDELKLGKVLVELLEHMKPEYPAPRRGLPS